VVRAMHMKLALILARTRRPLRRFLADKRGVSAVEFAMLLPLMVTLYLGGVEVSSAVAIDRKVTLIVRTLGDLVSQATSVDDPTMTSIFAATTAVMAPYPDSTLNITVSSVQINSQGVAKVSWSNAKPGHGTPHPIGSTVTLPAALNVPSTSLIWAEASYAYTPTIGYVMTGTKNLTDQIYMRPRLSDCVLRPTTQTSC
jgi:Flp pilus assembly protein TadG